MKIAIIGPVSPWRGGIAKYLDSLSNTLELQTNAVAKITFKRQYPKLLRPNQHKIDNVRSPNVYVAIDMLNPLSWPKLAKELQEEAFDLAVFKYWHPYFARTFGYFANKLRKAGTKICFIVDNVTPHEWFPFSKLLTRYCLQNGDLFIAHSQKVTDDLNKLLPMALIRQVPHPAYNYSKKESRSLARERLKLPEKSKVIMFFGYIRPYKGLDILLDAFALLQSWYSDSLLLIAGEAFEDMKKYKAKADMLGVYERVIWNNYYIPDDEVRYYFSAADLLVLPYKKTTQSGIVEIARNFDLPVIASDAGGLSGQVECVVPPDNPPALAQAMVRFFADSVKCGFKQPQTTFEDLTKAITK